MPSCSLCSQAFEVTDDDLAFYDKVSPVFAGKKYAIPAPTLCPDCRRQRRCIWRNERAFFQRTCDLCRKSIISVHPPENPYPVYCLGCWRGTTWDPLQYGRPYDAEKDFFTQFASLYQSAPQRATVSEEGLTCENCEYCFDISYSKNCYRVFGTWKTEDSLYTNLAEYSKFCVDCYDTKLGSEWVYECLDSQRLYHCSFLQNSDNCHDCLFGFDLKGCKDCLGCVNLRQKQFCIFNEQCTEETYKKRRQSYNLSTWSGVENFRREFSVFALQFPRRCLNQQQCELCVGDHLFNCKDVTGTINCNSENSRWIERSDTVRNCYDILQSGNPQWCLELITGDNAYAVLFSMYCNHSKYLLYCSDCLTCEHCIGCVSLRNKKYCIFNTQYTKEEYEALAGSILQAMQTSAEFGEFLPSNISPFGYNDTNAGEFYPLSREDVLQRGWRWQDNHPTTTQKETLATDQIPEEIQSVDDSMLSEILACVECQKNYRLIAQELRFYRTMNIPIPRHCPDCRHRSRLLHRNGFMLFDRSCAKCQTQITTSYSPERPEIVYCEECYLKEVY